MNPIDSRRRLLAGAMVATPLVFAAANVTFPSGTFQYTGTTEHALDALEATAAAPGRVRVASLLLVAAAVLLAVSFAAVASMVRERGARLATAAAVLGVIGSAGLVLVTSWLGLSVYAAQQSDLSKDAAATYLVTLTNDSGLGNIAGGCYMLGLLLGSILMGVALFRSGRVAWWLAALFPVGVLTSCVFAPQGPPAAVMGLPLLIALPLLAREVAEPDTATPAVQTTPVSMPVG